MPRKILSGKIVGCKMEKTVVVQVRTPVNHPIYKKVVFRSKKYSAHDPDGFCKGKEGEMIKIIESRPHSKTKKWEIII